MPEYLLSMPTVQGEVGPSMTDEEMQESWRKVVALNEEMTAAPFRESESRDRLSQQKRLRGGSG